ncbi:MAG: glycoside hydrolase family 16 protein [Gemmatimonadota bacterium]
MRRLLRRLGYLLALAAVASCGSEPVTPADVAVEVPTNLTLDVELQGQPSDIYGDGSGVALLRATGSNVSLYEFRFDGGGSYLNGTGELSYTFTDEGTRAYGITVLFYSPTGAADSISTEVTVRVAPPESGERVLVWSDEFDYEGAADADKWHHQVIPILGDDWANGEVQHYTDRLDNAHVTAGTLRIVAKREDYTFQGVTKEFTSARLNSTYVFTYGRVDIRARLPAEAGTWPALWTLGANIDEVGNFHGSLYGSVGWPACGEIDIMEQNGWDKDHLIGHLHWGDTQTGVYDNRGGTRAVTQATAGFNVYSLVWTEELIQILFNDVVFFEAPNTDRMPYDNPHYLLMNIAMGGNLGGAIPGGFSEAVMEVDYVRIYQ